MKAILSVIGKDKLGIIAKVSNFLYSVGVNIEDISQTIMQDYFTMIMLVDLSPSKKSLVELTKLVQELSSEIGVKISLQNEEVFNAMHKL